MRRFLIPVVAAGLVLAAGRPAAAAGLVPAAAADEKGKRKKEGDGERRKENGDREGKKKGEGDGERRGEKGDRESDGGKLPKAVAAAVKDIFPGMRVVKAKKEDEDGEQVYEVILRGKGGMLEAKITPKGRVVEVELNGGGDGDKGEKKGKKEEEHEKGEKAKGKKGDDGDKGEKKSKKGDDDDKGKRKKGDRD